jgi:hypothetical protein
MFVRGVGAGMFVFARRFMRQRIDNAVTRRDDRPQRLQHYAQHYQPGRDAGSVSFMWHGTLLSQGGRSGD